MQLWEYLEQSGESFGVFGRRIGRSASTVWRTASGATRPDWPTMDRIGKATKGLVTAADFAQQQTPRKRAA